LIFKFETLSVVIGKNFLGNLELSCW